MTRWVVDCRKIILSRCAIGIVVETKVDDPADRGPPIEQMLCRPEVPDRGCRVHDFAHPHQVTYTRHVRRTRARGIASDVPAGKSA